jgi:hypothetical protein
MHAHPSNLGTAEETQINKADQLSYAEKTLRFTPGGFDWHAALFADPFACMDSYRRELTEVAG